MQYSRNCVSGRGNDAEAQGEKRERIKKKLEGLGKVQSTWHIMYH